MKRFFNNKHIYNCNTIQRYASGFPIDNDGNYKIINLNGNWKFKFFNNSKLVPNDFGANDFDYSDFDEINVPIEWQITGKYDEPIYTNINYPKAINTTNFLNMPKIYEEKTSCGLYVKEFTVDNINQTDNQFIHFQGVNPCCEVYLNGEFIGYSEDTFDFQEYNVSKYLKAGKNVLMVAVFRYCTGSYLEDQDMWRLSGIFRDVLLINKPQKEIFDIYAISEFENGNYNECKLKINVTLNNLEQQHKIDIIIKEKDSKKVLFTKQEMVNDGLNEFNYNVTDFKLWSHEIPNLYEIEVILYDDSIELDRRKTNFGFREVKIVPYDDVKKCGPFILLNGKQLKFRGVNRHEFHPEYGHAVPVELIESDIKLCKENNITAIRTSHYPNKREFYDLCDKYGILVMCENNLETHGLSFCIPKNSKYWTEQCVYRIKNMVNTFKNHPCIVSWSLGNESGCGKAFVKMKEEILKIDTTRFIHYEEDITGKISDVFSEMYGPQEKMKKIGENKRVKHCFMTVFKPLGVTYSPALYKDLPYMQCEYAHCMGNSLGNFKDYWEDFKKYDRLAGGFIWDFADQAIKVVNKEGKIEYRFGGDFGDKPNDGVFAFNGIVRADRSPNPALYEVRKEYQMIEFAIKENRIFIKNKYMFLDIAGFSYNVEFINKGNVVNTINGNINSLLPNNYIEIDINDGLKELDKQNDTSVVVNVFDTNNNKIAYEQFVISEPVFNTNMENDDSIKVNNEDYKVEITSKDLKICFDKQTGYIKSIKKNQKEILISPIRPNFVRPTIDNDRFAQVNIDFVKTIMGVYKFHNAIMKPKKIDVVNNEDSSVSINVNWKYKFGKFTTNYLINNGKIIISMSIKPNTNLIRYGFTFELAKDYRDNLSFFANGPFENYCDRKSAAIAKIYNGNIDEFCHEYLSPQENGNHTEARYFNVKSVADDTKVNVSAYNKTFEFSVLPYSFDSLEKSTHAHEVEKSDHLYVYVDGRQRGVGGDVPAIASLKPQYIIKKKETHEFSFKIEIL